MRLPNPPLLVITDRNVARRLLVDVVAAAFDGGCRWVMVREKDLSTEDLARTAGDIVALGRCAGATVTVNGDAAAARAAAAHGIHLPQGRSVREARSMLGGDALIGVSAHSIEEAEAAARNGAGYVTLSPVFETVSKPGYGPPLGPDGVARAAAAVPIPVLALGGIDAANVGACLAAGAAGVAVMGSVMRAGDPAAVVDRIVRRLVGRGEPAGTGCQ